MVLGNPGGKVLIYLPINEGFIPFPSKWFFFRSFFTKMTRHEMDFNGPHHSGLLEDLKNS